MLLIFDENNSLINDVSQIVFEYYNPLISEYEHCFHTKTMILLSRIHICLEHFRLDCVYRIPPLIPPIVIDLDELVCQMLFAWVYWLAYMCMHVFECVYVNGVYLYLCVDGTIVFLIFLLAYCDF